MWLRGAGNGILLYNALTLSLALISAPLSSRATTVAVWPVIDAWRSIAFRKSYKCTVADANYATEQVHTYVCTMHMNIAIHVSFIVIHHTDMTIYYITPVVLSPVIASW